MVEVLFFAGLKEQAGTDRVTLDAAGMTVKELKETCMASFPIASLHQAMTAINEEYVQENDLIQQGDIVAFIPPVSGG